MDRQDIRIKIKESMELATLSAVTVQAVQMLRNPDVDIRMVAETVSYDQSMASKILRLVNSSFYGFQGKIGSLSQAIVLLGFSTVRSVILSVSVLQAFCGGKGNNVFDVGRFWEHSVGTAFIARNLAEHARQKQPEEAFIGGLLHDIGKVFVLQFLRKDLDEIMVLVKEKDMSIRAAEEAVLGVDHAWIGHTIVKNWHFPPNLCQGIGYHHSPNMLAERKEDLVFTSVIHMADIICRGLDIGSGGDDLVPDINTAAWNALSLSLDDVKTILKRVDKGLSEIDDFLNIIRS